MAELEVAEAMYRKWESEVYSIGQSVEQAFIVGALRGMQVHFRKDALNYIVTEFPPMVTPERGIVLRTRLRRLPEALDMFHEHELDRYRLQSIIRGAKPHVAARLVGEFIDREMVSSLRLLTSHSSMRSLRIDAATKVFRDFNTKIQGGEHKLPWEDILDESS